jgi:DNA polymerase-3 subunit gamma/tau
MSYLVLARKYRPRNFSEMVGQSHVVQALGNALQTQRLHHAYLFTGTRGVGKTTVSRILAKSLNCVGSDGQGDITDTPCGVCQACTDIDAGRFVDYTELDAASNRGVDEIAQLLEQAVYKPVVGRFKVFMIDEVHMLTNTAFNAMLKTLEEPPAYLKFVLATTDPQKVPATVLSRCLQFNLRPMAPETILEHLVQVLVAESVPAETQALRLLARAARGSMRDALSLTDQAIAFGSGRLDEAGVRQMLGSVDRSHVYRLLDALARADGRTVVETSELLRLNGLSAASTLEEMTAVLQRMAVLQAVPGIGADDDANDPDVAQTARLALSLPADETQLLYSLCLHGRAELGLAPDEYAALTMILLRLLAFKPRQAQIDSTVGSIHPLAAPQAGSAVEPEKKPLSETATLGKPAVAASVPRPAPSVVAPWDDLPAAAAPAGVLVRARAPVVMQAASPDDSRLHTIDQPASSPEAAEASGVDSETAVPAGASEPAGEPAGISRALPLTPIAAAQDASKTSETSWTTALGDVWAGWVNRLLAAELVGGLVRELALQSQCGGQDDDAWLLRVEQQSLNHPGACEKLLQALQTLGQGAPARLSVELGQVVDSPARRLAAAQVERQRQAQALVDNDPFVQAMIRDWGARIVPGSVQPVPSGSANPI